MAVLAYLASRPGETVHADELLENVWPGKVVTNASVYNCITELRQAFLHCDDGQTYVDTIPKKGYRLVATVTKPDEARAGAGLRGVSLVVSRRLAIIVASLVAAGIFLYAYRQSDEVLSPAISIAVLPFVNMSEDPDQEHFADGLSEELLNSLSSIGELRVISRTSSFSFKNRNASTSEVAAALRVNHLLDGSVRRAGDTVRITAQLIDASSDSRVWSDSYDRELNVSNILDIQREIALKVVSALNVRLLPGVPAVRARDGPDNLAALDSYHDGMFFLRQIETGQSVSRQTFEAATKSFEAAIAADPDWAAPHAALGRTYHFRFGNLDDPDPAEVLSVSTRHVLQAIDIDENYGPAYKSLGYILATSGDYEGAVRAFDQARSLNEGAYWARAILMLGIGKYDEAIEDYRSAVHQDPLSTSIRSQLAGAYLCAGRYADALEAAQDDYEMSQDEAWAVDWKVLLAESYLRAGDREKGRELVTQLSGQMEDGLYVAYLLALAGEDQRARAILDSQEIASTKSFLEAAWTFAVFGEENQTLSMLEHAAASALNESQPLLVLETVNCVPEIRNFSGNARYKALLSQLGLKD